MAYDSRCLDLAMSFLHDSPFHGIKATNRDAGDLAQHIQDAIEGWFQDHTIPSGPKPTQDQS